MFNSPFVRLCFVAIIFFVLGKSVDLGFGGSNNIGSSSLTKSGNHRAFVSSFGDPHGPPARVLASVITDEEERSRKVFARAMRDPKNPISGGVASQLQYKNSPLSRMIRSYCRVEGGVLSCGVKRVQSVKPKTNNFGSS